MLRHATQSSRSLCTRQINAVNWQYNVINSRRGFRFTPNWSTEEKAESNNGQGNRNTGRLRIRGLVSQNAKKENYIEEKREQLKKAITKKYLDDRGKSDSPEIIQPKPAVQPKPATRIRLSFINQMKPMELCAEPLELTASAAGGTGGGEAAPSTNPNNKNKGGTEQPETSKAADTKVDLIPKEYRAMLREGFSELIREDILNSVITGLSRRSHVFLYAEDAWSEGYSIELLNETAHTVGGSLIAVDIPDLAALTSHIDPILEDLTIVSYSYAPPPDLEAGSSENDEGGGVAGNMGFFSSINRKRDNNDGDSMSEQYTPTEKDNDVGEEDYDGDEWKSGGRDVDSSRAKAGSGKGSSDPVLSSEMMTNPLAAGATKKLDRVLYDFVSTPVVDANGIEQPKLLAVKHLGDLLNTRVGYTLFSRLVAAATKYNNEGSHNRMPVMVVGLLHPSWFHPRTPPPGIPPFDTNPATPVALMPAEPSAGRSSPASRIGNLFKNLMGENGGRLGGDGQLGVHVVQMEGLPGFPGLGGNRFGRSMRDDASVLEKLPLFARVGIPPPTTKAQMAAFSMDPPEFVETQASGQQIVGSLRQAMVAEQCLDRNARVIRNICLLYQINGLQLTKDEAEFLATSTAQDGLKAVEKVVFEREPAYDDSETQILPKQPAPSVWHLDYRPLSVMLRTIPGDIARRYFLSETFLHRWISLAQALAVRDSIDITKRDPRAILGASAVLSSAHLRRAWTQTIATYVALEDGVLERKVDGGEGVFGELAYEEIGIGRKVYDDLDIEPGAESFGSARHEGEADEDAKYAEWSSIGKEAERDPDAAKSNLNTSVPSARKRIQRAEKGLSEYEQRLMTSVVDPQTISTGFDQVCVKRETATTLQEIITLPLIRPEYFSSGVLNRHNVSGILLFGPPGTGKTMLAKAVAKESGSIVLNIRASDIYDKYVGEGEKLAEAVFTLARKLAPCVIFIDEVDALFSARSSGEVNKFRRDVMNQIMSEWDGISSATNAHNRAVMVMAATNRPFDLDDAILRRLPRRILVDLPTPEDRAKILQIHLGDQELGSDVDLESIAKRAESFSGSDLKNLCIAAALAALRERVKAEVGESAGDERTVIERLKAEGGKRSGEGPIAVERRHFDAAFKKVAPSSSDQMESLVELRKWDKLYGDGAQERTRKHHAIGFAAGSSSSSPSVEQKAGDGLSVGAEEQKADITGQKDS